MPRPLRLEYEDACYHVMNRGARRQDIFNTNKHREQFLDIVQQAVKLFGVEIYAYCLMDNHYHLLIKTPRANLSRAMRHINGVYTQYYNRDKGKDGSLFRGRYKAIIVDGESYLLQVSRYIHLNPVEAKLVKKAEKYLWSSYLGYLQSRHRVSWLNTDDILGMMSGKRGVESYKKFVEEGVDEESSDFYKKINVPVFFGKKENKDKLLKKVEKNRIKYSMSDYKRTQDIPTLEQVCRACAKHFGVPEKNLFQAMRGKINEPRKIAIYGSRVWASERLSVIADRFSCKNHSSISNTVREIDERVNSDKKIRNALLKIKNELKMCQS